MRGKQGRKSTLSYGDVTIIDNGLCTTGKVKRVRACHEISHVEIMRCCQKTGGIDNRAFTKNNAIAINDENLSISLYAS